MNYKKLCEKLATALMEDVKEDADLQIKLNHYRDLAQEAMFLRQQEETIKDNEVLLEKLSCCGGGCHE